MSIAVVKRRPVLVAVVAGVLVIAGVVAVLVATSGPSAPGDVTFVSAGREESTGPAQWCDIEVTECDDDPEALAELPVPPGAPVTVTVPDEVAQTPWQVVFSFSDAAGAEQLGRSELQRPGGPATYTLVVPDPAGELISAEVQQYGARLSLDGFVTRATWVLSASRR